MCLYRPVEAREESLYKIVSEPGKGLKDDDHQATNNRAAGPGFETDSI
jgi:hypothetical protein